MFSSLISRFETRWLLSALLLAGTFAAYSGVFQLEYIDYDDDRYIYKNERIQNGFTWKSLQESFKVFESNWHPVTWWSHMLDFTLFGLNPKGHHLTNLLIHSTNTLLLFFILSRMTGAFGRSAFVSALFALHPLHVESVAWVSERKDLLCVSFWLGCMGAYSHCIKHPTLGSRLSVFVFFILGLMSKPMIITLPFFLLLLDVWPLNRISIDSLKKCSSEFWDLVWEKIPLLIFSILSLIITFSAQLEARNLIGWKYRLGNSITAYVEYLEKAIWPVNLAIFYPHPGAQISIPKILICLSTLIAITFLAIQSVKKRPYITVGWFWYIGTLAPVIGLVQVGSQAFADRYTYMPLNGIFIILAWAGFELLTKAHCSKLFQSALAFGLCLALLATTRFQVSHWESSYRLFEHATEVVPGNYLAHYKLGKLLMDQGQIEQGLIHFKKAVRQAPNHPLFHFSLGNALVLTRKSKEAIKEFDQVIASDSSFWEAHLNKAEALSQLGRLKEAEHELRTTLKIKPQSKKAYNNLGLMKLNQKQLQKAVEFFKKAIALDASFAEAHNNLGAVLGALKKFRDATIQYRIAVLLNPELVEAHFNLANILTADSKFSKAILHYKEALKTGDGRAEIHHNLGTLLIKLSKKEEAIQSFRNALQKNPDFIPSQHALANLTKP